MRTLSSVAAHRSDAFLSRDAPLRLVKRHNAAPTPGQAGFLAGSALSVAAWDHAALPADALPHGSSQSGRLLFGYAPLRHNMAPTFG